MDKFNKDLTPREMTIKANKYFNEVEPEKWNIANICLYMGISKGKYNYVSTKDEFKDVTEYISTRIEDKYLQELMSRYPTGAIFALKNFAGYTDQKDIKTTLAGNITLEQLVRDTKVKA